MKPTRPGFYWFKFSNPTSGKDTWEPVKVIREHEELVVNYPGTDLDDYVDDTQDADWGEEIIWRKG